MDMIANIAVVIKVNQAIEPARTGDKRITVNVQRANEYSINREVIRLFFEAGLAHHIKRILFAETER